VPNNVVVYYAENSTERYASKAEFTPDCGAFTSASKSGNKHLLANDTGPGITFNTFNSNNGNLNAVTDNQTFTTGEEVVMQTNWYGRTDQSLSAYGKVIAIMDYNDSEFDGAFFSFGGNPRTSVPTYHTPVNFATNFKSLAWNIPGGPDPSALVEKTGRWTFKGDIVTKADAAVNPTSNNARSFFNVTLCTEDWFQEIDSGQEVFGTENSRGTRQGFPCASTVIYYS